MKTFVPVLLVATAVNSCCFADSILQDPRVQTSEPPSIPPIATVLPVASLPYTPYRFSLAECAPSYDCVFLNTSMFDTWYTLFLTPLQPVSHVMCSGTLPCVVVNKTSGVIMLDTFTPPNDYFELTFSGFAKGTRFKLSSQIPEPQTITLVCGSLLVFCLIGCRRARHRAG
jgi:hypothetical protein